MSARVPMTLGSAIPDDEPNANIDTEAIEEDVDDAPPESDDDAGADDAEFE